MPERLAGTESRRWRKEQPSEREALLELPLSHPVAVYGYCYLCGEEDFMWSHDDLGQALCIGCQMSTLFP